MVMKLKCIAIDDSSVQRAMIVKLIENHLSLNLIGEFSNSVEAKKFIITNELDLIFLDIEMPLINGFDLLEGLHKQPQVIIITSKADYAAKAFDYNATDFLQKPIEKNRFTKAVDKAVAQFKIMQTKPIDESETIIVKSNLKKYALKTKDIKFIQADGDYIKIKTDKDIFMVLSTMKSFEEKLDKNKFMRIHKSFIVNLDRISNFNAKTILLDNEEIPISREKKLELEKILKIGL